MAVEWVVDLVGSLVEKLEGMKAEYSVVPSDHKMVGKLVETLADWKAYL
jgi:hypothetical protein